MPKFELRGPWCYFEIVGGGGGGGRGLISDSILGGRAQDSFLLTLYKFKNIGGGHAPTPSPPDMQSLFSVLGVKAE